MEGKGRRLRTAKEIAAYLGCCRKTVHRYIVAAGLPAVRIGTRGQWTAYTADLDLWERGQVGTSRDN